MTNEFDDDPFLEASFDAFSSSASGEEALGVLAFTAGIDVEEALIRVASNAPEIALRAVFANLLRELLHEGYGDQALDLVAQLAQVSIEMGLED